MRLRLHLDLVVVRGVETHQGGEQANISLGDAITHEVTVIGQALLKGVWCPKQLVKSVVVGVLGAGETTAVHAVIDGGEHHGIEFVNLWAQVLGIQIWGIWLVVLVPLGGKI